jgi:glucose/arabinose dehydrogenase
MTGLNPNFEYRLSVFARDAAGNVSDSSALAICRTQPITDDTTPPTVPGNLVHSNVGQTNVTLTWNASTDVGTGVRAYLVRNASNAVIHTVSGNPPATTTVVPNLACGTSHTLHVVARDGANNVSGPSNTRTFTTTACGRGQPQTPANVSTGWTIPWDIDWAPNGQFALITERDHFRVWRLSITGQKTQVGTVPNSVTTNGEGGLMGVAFSPTWNGTSDQEVFFMHTSNDGGATQNRVVKMNFNGTSLSNRQVILAGIRSNRFHNGGRIKFGPDGFLYVTAGDAQQDSNGQNRDALNGKILRITKTGAAAPGNPFGTRIYSWGHRNPQGLAWDSAGRLWSSELMNNANDELNLILPGRNYGWPTCQGSCNVAGMENPKRTWGVAEASPSGIAIVNDTVYMAALRGQRLWRIELNGTNVGSVSNHFVNTFGRLRAVSKVPGASAIWIGTTNADNNGGDPDGSDRILRSNIQ